MIPGLNRLPTFWRALVVRALRTAIQVTIPALGAGLVGVDYGALGAMVAGAVVLSVLTSVLTGLPEVPEAEPPAEG